MKWYQIAFVVSAVSVVTSPSVAQERFDLSKLDRSKYHLQMTKVDQGPKLDGVLDDPVWSQSPVATDFVQFSPEYLAPASEQTEVRVLYDEENLYVGALCLDSEPDKVVGRETRRDANIFETDDTFAFTLSPFADGSVTILFNTSPLGAQRDVYFGNYGETFNDSWDGIWRVKARRNDKGWAVEVAIPFKTLRFKQADVQDWLIIFRRQVRRKRETAYWPPLDRAFGRGTMNKMQQGAKLIGLKDVKPGRSLEILPYVTGGTVGKRVVPNPANLNQTSVDFSGRGDIGGDVKWGITPEITVDATINPDFANIESDREVVNLSRFEFRFQEKRPFFLEGVDLFGFGQSTGFGAFQSSSLPLFFSRRIGSQNADGSFTPIHFAAKLSGKVGRTNFAYLNAQTGKSNPSVGPPVLRTNWQVMRIRQDFGSETSIGVMGLFKEKGETFGGFSKNAYNRLVGFDSFYRLGKTQHRFEMLFAKSWLPATDPRMVAIAGSNQKANTAAGSVKHSWRSQYLSTSTSYIDIREGFFSDLGFVNRRDIRRLSSDAFLANVFIRKHGIREIQAQYTFNYIDDHIGSFFSKPASWNIAVGPSMELENGIGIGARWSHDFDRLAAPVPVAGVTFPARNYTYDQVSGAVSTDPGKSVVLITDLTYGKLYDGTLVNSSVQLTLKPIARLLLDFDTTVNRLERKNPVAADSTKNIRNNALINRIRVSYSFSPEFFITSFIQLNRSTSTNLLGLTGTTTSIGSNLLIAYQLQAGHSFYVAYNQISDNDYASVGINPIGSSRPFRNTGSSIVAKIQYLFNI